MQITKCDKCKKNITGEKIVAGYGYLARVELCRGCGKSIELFLKKHKLVKDPMAEFQKKR